MKALIGWLIFAGVALAQSPVQCLVSGTWVPCSLITGVQEAQAVNTKVSGSGGTTITNAFGSSTTPGNAILCIGFESAAAVPVFTDAQANTYVVIASSATAPGYSIALANNIVGGTTDTVTLTTTSGAASFACHELKGAVQAGQVWDVANGQQGTGSSIAFSTLTASVPNEMVFLGVALGGGTVNATPSLGSNPTSLVTVDMSNTAVTGGAALSIMYAAHTSLSNAPSFLQTVSLNASQTFSGALVTVKPVTMPTGTYQVTSATLQNAATGNGNGTVLPVQGYSSVMFTINCSVACSGGTTVNLEGSDTDGNYVAIIGIQVGATVLATAITNQGTTPTLWEAPVAGLTQVRARISAYSAGTITVKAQATGAPWPPQIISGAVNPGNTPNTVPWLAAPAAESTTANSALTSYLTSTASTNSTSVKGSAGNVYGYSILNTTATVYYLRMYNSASAPTCSSATGFVETIPIPASTSGAGVERWPHVPQGFTTGIGFCLTGGGSSTDNSNAATGVYATILFK